ncbi:Zn-dependent peptidase ImmA (M78 family) [Xanthomonas arboricola]|uniref:ImmA/IrrE family metallo-endopeptidase n=1 Tax=Xanthomonas TaxID=338 RepID=UPI000CEDFA73|nr:MULTISPECIES: ImmA/IrrE family metallo-endopeptidase [Xanthomonas]MBB5737247.1 Zn-dependent peptidase ImmA (M78 family) [Xanthomonas sp. CFBP 8152]PPT80555.1 hypothetical protein XarbCFBP8152_04820 [Xanthomonas arboricola]PPU46748.1 hypothetical protein XarbCFBP7697_13925 [Xanthomonas arboricola]
MSPERRAANDLLIAKWTGRPLPIDPAVLANSIGVITEDVVFEFDRDPEMHGVSGQYIGSPVPTIRYSATEHGPRRRFTIAHELGHHVMKHGDRFRDTQKAFFSNNWDPVEVSANKFAAELLMPFVIVERFVLQEGITDISRLAEKFGVSEAAMRYRLINLNLLTG